MQNDRTAQLLLRGTQFLKCASLVTTAEVSGALTKITLLDRGKFVSASTI